MIHTSLFYKEWIKTKRAIYLFAVLLVVIIAYTYINTSQQFRIDGAIQVWSNVILKDMSLVPDIVMWFPLLAGVLLGVVQYIPEMVNKRFKLTLHLPLPERNIVVSMLVYGLMILVATFVVYYAGLYSLLSIYYTGEIIEAFSLKVLPWLLGGITAYLFTTWICLEPTWKQRICNTLGAISGLSLFYIGAKSGAYSPLLVVLFAILIISLLFPLYSTSRFKEGVQ
ncbi:hypothetical protein LJB98_01680 [Bacteroidales bacterium OttesenSCG-928-M11]|nr:hypothetical protein [Bacteroidales bacterium OttesenSCG-928-M11]